MNSKSDINSEIVDARVQALKQRFAYQFSGPNSGHDIEPGWFDLVEQTCVAVDLLIPASQRENFYWRQIKQKFGGLRMYYSGGPLRVDLIGVASISIDSGSDRSDAIREIVSRAEAASFEICEVCGAVGRLRTDRGYVQTLCDRHAAAR